MGKRHHRVRILWTETAKECLKKLPKAVQQGLFDKADELAACDDPRRAHKPLTGPLANYYRITYARYRAVYRVDEERLASGDSLITITVTFVAAGKREERSKDDIYRVAQKLVEAGLAPSGGAPVAKASAGLARGSSERSPTTSRRDKRRR